MAFELGSAISKTSEMDALKEMQIKLGEDQEASGLIMRYQEARAKADNKLQDGMLITATEENHLEILQQELKSNTMVQELIQVQEKFNNLMQGVYFALNQAISGEECSSSDCSSCGGSCSM
jgi:cell fate (sporulation/competence/biofilm development) regulator YlbF (YheA/YmcA/DUF963 family)